MLDKQLSLDKEFQNQILLYCSSYDSMTELINKYPEYISIHNKLNQISKSSNFVKVQIMHNIDATNISNSLQLFVENQINNNNQENKKQENQEQQGKVDQNMDLQQSNQSQINQGLGKGFLKQNLEIQQLSQDFSKINLQNQVDQNMLKILIDSQFKFDKIIFNHPHSGQDDLTKNSSLVAHYLHNAQQNLENLKSEIQFSLLKDQFERWQLNKIMDYQNLNMVYRSNLPREIYENGFQARRNLVGSNFQSGQVASTFNKISIDSEIFIISQDQSIKQDIYDPFKKQLKEFNVQKEEEGKLAQLQKDQQKQDKQNNQEKISQTEKQIQKQNDSQLQFQCQYCQKGFRTQQGKKTHEREEHEKKNNKTKKNDQVFECKECGRVFKRQEGLNDHILTKHNQNLNEKDLKPDFAGTVLKIIDKNEVESQQYACKICYQDFLNEQNFNEHKSYLTPDLKPQQIIKCKFCERIFKENRALNLHLLSCKSKKN
ncbi:hypothetical protein PPERSA_02982 [Pseudocohnilembus persalinus]|uniref:C2H2-type domain-containing protein n=1 Tax=Pseudocohnilembus persalinus TaxID=266149 RepID=A0A0V0QET2_PSEPJ|nr:hypothetical protein PPERSA_02982 [Pseudocohnilembus persalinus]|eukprot:KRX00722.1 hypothetical protein PPERSA_02982 [Pseudocohnilembus persalinus]